MKSGNFLKEKSLTDNYESAHRTQSCEGNSHSVVNVMSKRVRKRNLYIYVGPVKFYSI